TPTAYGERDEQANQHPEYPRAVHPDDQWILPQPLTVNIILGHVLEKPADVRVPQTDHWAVRIALVIGMRVVFNMSGCPVDRTALRRHRTANQDQRLDKWIGLEAAVREHAMQADGDAETG